MNEREKPLAGRILVGVDEAGRAPLAGPVVAAAVALPAGEEIPSWRGITDSKKLTALARERYYAEITARADYAVAMVSAREIEALDIHRASLLAMKRAAEKLPSLQDAYALVDGKFYPEIDCPGEAIIGGDGSERVIGAASIVAKVVRDRIMTSMHHRFPEYGFDRHKGYPTPFHRNAIRLLGPCKEHRRTFAGVKEYLEGVTVDPALAQCIHDLRRCKSRADCLRLQEAWQTQAFDEQQHAYLAERLKYLILEWDERENRKPSTRKRGASGEDLAARYLAQKGYQIWEKNYHAREGEIDLVACRGHEIVFVEVKTRSSERYGAPLESVTRKKQRAMIEAADKYLYDRDIIDQFDIRYDVIGIIAPRNAAPQIEHIEDAFRVEEPL